MTRKAILAAVLGLTLLIGLSPSVIIAQGQQVVDLVLEPAQVTVKKGDTFTLTINAKLNGQPIAGVDAIMDFNPNLLEVVDADTNQGGVQIKAGSALPSILYNMADNIRGEITYGAGIRLGTPYPTENLTVATLTFRAKATGSTAVSFLTAGPGDTNVLFEQTSVFRSASGTGVGIESSPAQVPVAKPAPAPTPTPPPPPPASKPAPSQPPPAQPPAPPAAQQPAPAPTSPAEKTTSSPTPPAETPKPAPSPTPAPAGETPGAVGVNWIIWPIIGGVAVLGVVIFVLARRGAG